MEHRDQPNKPLDLDLVFTLSEIDFSSDSASKPVCTRCDNLGKSGGELVIERDASVFACACWKELTGWELFGLYHEGHDRSTIVTSNPNRPTALLRGRLEQTGHGSNGDADTYSLTNLSLVDIEYPGALEP